MEIEEPVDELSINDEELLYDTPQELLSHIFREKHCVCCKKTFCRADWTSYAYKIKHAGGHLFFCSWSCMQKYRRIKEAKKPQKSLPIATEKELQKKNKYASLTEPKRSRTKRK
ncbi:MAG: hypothetical protein NC218_02285 [Acetobacter sp.]|nr:hypothetical protein [Acetobacter sp.]